MINPDGLRTFCLDCADPDSRGPVQAYLTFVAPSAFDAVAAIASRVLHAVELSYFQGLPSEKRRADFLLGRYAAKHALSRLTNGLKPESIEIRAGAFHQPVVFHDTGLPLAVSISHCRGIVAALAHPATHPFGIDTEVVDAAHLDALRGHVGMGELPEPPAGLSEADRYTRVWTVKEALSKALGCGLTASFEVFEIAERREWDGTRMSGSFSYFPHFAYVSLGSPGRISFALVRPRRTEITWDEGAVCACLEELSSKT
jgi:4'-phosphopantetheinyl transferase